MQASNSANQDDAPPPELLTPPPPPELDMRLSKEVHRLASCKAIVIFSKSDCCMSSVVKKLNFGMSHGTVELYQWPDGAGMQEVLHQLAGTNEPIPVVFMGRNYFDRVEKLMASHINGSLIALLKEARALWL